MNSWMKKIGLGIALGATAMTTVAAPAEAQRFRGGGYHGYRGGGAGTAIVAGIAGLAVGAAIASDRGYRGGYYDRGYYNGGYHSYYDGYRGGYYDGGYYRGGYYPRGGCFIERRWDRYYDRPVNVRICR